MRCYHFGNMYLSSIQQGIQAAHAQMELFNKYVSKTEEDSVPEELFNQLFDWSANHKTMICLNGGNLKEMEKLYNFLNTKDNPYPYSKFNEGEEALGGVLTNIAIVLPKKIYQAVNYINNDFIFFNYQENKISINLGNIHSHEKKNQITKFIKNNTFYSQFEISLIFKICKMKSAI